ncbi:ABC transporter ATP-binding protein [Paenibacillus naphthalenovorans]|uniref:ABC transporter ATP-binding protein n=1 Tax=Paenibacillus naphthalenovorans TaxID=162209 RepID=UPI00087FD134|nr:ABC transporter ATP-binding protein [Paenibacillus naphthalenovorans]SDJ86504.1 peptide/nickel transport system ATP-binding protein/oligopeptide transport system ATP-binding protein/dipeptide transport system ATP-binding protein [Paenibacillus naphthalenovorans]
MAISNILEDRKKNRLLDVQNLSAYLTTADGTVKAVDRVSFTIDQGEIMAVVGESGSGKTMMISSIMNMIPSHLLQKLEGSVMFQGEKLFTLSEKKMREIRGNGMAMVFQNAMTALDPSYTIGSQLMELLREKKGLSSQAAKKRSLELLFQVGMPAPEKMFSSYAHRLSGGLRQRAVIAMALSCEPSLIIADEPTTALDPTVQLQIIELFEKINKETGTAILLITHDFGVVARLAQKVAVMYAGQIVEQGSLEELLQSPAHPYTRSLLACIPSTQWIFSGKEKQKLVQIEGAPPSLAHLPPGCHFADRCPEVEAICRKEKPEMVKINHTAEVRCWKRG